uniref:Uncharacterized protein n=1 Tax=Triticum urartu TaxID=4572 RepID=A0A8R7TYT6_TRIUA
MKEWQGTPMSCARLVDLSFLSVTAGSSRSSTLSLSWTPAMCRWSPSSLSRPRYRSRCSLGQSPVASDSSTLRSPKVAVASTDTSCCHPPQPADTFTRMASTASSQPSSSGLCTSIPPGRTSHSILSCSATMAHMSTPPMPPAVLLDRLLNSLLGLGIFTISAPSSLCFSLPASRVSSVRDDGWSI